MVDLETGDQPVANEDGDVVAVFNGELYDFRELGASSRERGHVIRGTGDTPLHPAPLRAARASLPERLEGMFAIALWDAARERLVLVRDRVGKKPLLYASLPDGSLAFASELKALLRCPASRASSTRGRSTRISRSSTCPAADGVAGVAGCRPGTSSSGRTASRGRALLGSSSPAARAVRRRVARARTRRRCAPRFAAGSSRDVPLGALLSGGIDSTIVVGLMARGIEPSPCARSRSASPTPATTSGTTARLVAERYGTEHEELVVEPDPAELVSRLASILDEPLGDEAILPTLLISEVRAGT